MGATQAAGDQSSRLKCALILILTALLQSVCVAVTYMYISKELKQMQDKNSKSAIACFLKEDDSPWDFVDEESMKDPCWQIKWQLRQFVRKINLRNHEETISAVSEKQQAGLLPVRGKGLQRVAAHITGTSQRNSFPSSYPKNEKILGHKITSWESSRKGHSFLTNMHLRKGELNIHQTGFYYIYSQTYFRFLEPEDAPTAGNKKKNKQMVQYIYKVTADPDPVLLMKSARNSCWSKDSEYGLYSIYQGGIFELQEHDRIFVSVTHEPLVDMDQAASYFGAFLVG